MRSIMLLLILLLHPTSTEKTKFRYFIVWNVGQGSWSTLVESQECLHFDMGGTSLKFALQLKKLCGAKKNILYLTHFDHDHINLIRKARMSLPDLCLATAAERLESHTKEKLLNSLSSCKNFSHPSVRQLYRATFNETNDSHVYLIDKMILITGDLPAKKEKSLNIPSTVRIYLAGHHGSRTSSSQRLLSQLAGASSIASCAKAKYGHPHKEAVKRHTKAHVPLLVTEIYGNIFLEL